MPTMGMTFEETKLETEHIPHFKFALTRKTIIYSTYRPEYIFKHVIKKLKYKDV